MELMVKHFSELSAEELFEIYKLPWTHKHGNFMSEQTMNKHIKWRI